MGQFLIISFDKSLFVKMAADNYCLYFTTASEPGGGIVSNYLCSVTHYNQYDQLVHDEFN